MIFTNDVVVSSQCIFSEISELEQCEVPFKEVITAIVTTIAVLELGIFFILINSADKKQGNSRSKGERVCM